MSRVRYICQHCHAYTAKADVTRAGEHYHTCTKCKKRNRLLVKKWQPSPFYVIDYAEQATPTESSEPETDRAALKRHGIEYKD